MTRDDSVSRWIEEVKLGNPDGAQAIWERDFPQLVRLARDRLCGVPQRSADEEDVALSALDSFCRAAEAGRFPDLADREGLWRLLARMTARKVTDLVRHEGRQGRGGGHVVGESAFPAADSTWGEPGLGRLAGSDPSPEIAAIVAEETQRLLGELEPELQRIALAKMEGYTNPEIAVRLQISVRTVERRLHLIRRIWEQELA